VATSELLWEKVLMNTLRAEVENRRLLESLIFEDGFLDTLVEGMILLDTDGVIVACNQAAAEILLVETDDLVGVNLFEARLKTVFEDGSPVPPGEHPLLATLQTGEPCLGVVIGVDLPRARRWLRTDARLFMPEGSVQGAVIRFTDITPQVMRERNFRMLLEVNRIMTSTTEVSEFLQRLCTGFVELGRCALASVRIQGGDQLGDVEFRCAVGATDFLYEGMDSWLALTKSGLGPTGTAMRTNVTQVVNVLATDPDYEPWRERAERFGFKSLVAVPFAFEQRVAVLTLYNEHPHAFDELAMEGLDKLAREIEFGIFHMQSVKSLATALNGTLAALAEMTESRDPYTAGHQVHVGVLGAAIARQLGLDPTMIELVRQSGQVHDVGKIAVPSEILTRPGKLSTLEFEMVKRHTTVGAGILSQASLPWPIAEVALGHHERMDGSGYPNSLLADEIILPARIVAVADVVEAMTQHRPYRPARGLDEALAEIRDGAGTLYDVDVVNACVAVFEGGFTFESGSRDRMD
jgi:HD-GYP domain-containing protein (c-di-GMP phosphodiesterase class II)